MMMIDAWQESWVNEWRQTRLISFMIYCSATDPDKRGCKNEFEFRKLPGDPTNEELEKWRAEAEEKEALEMEKRYKEVYRAAGIEL